VPLGEHRLGLQQPDRRRDLGEQRQRAVPGLLTGVARLEILAAAPLDEVGGALLVLSTVDCAGDPAEERRGDDDLPHRPEQALLLLGRVGREQIEDGQVTVLGGNDGPGFLRFPSANGCARNPARRAG
jgi:hypothetical protein